MMRSSPLANLVFIGYVFFPKAALGRLAPIFVYRDPPTSSPTSSPSYQPSLRPSLKPSSHPSSQPSSRPSSQPTSEPSLSLSPTSRPSLRPSLMPSSQPSMTPSVQPTIIPSRTPSSHPTSNPSSSPSTQPTLSVQPSSLSMSSSFVMSSEATSKPSTFFFWLITSVIGIVILLFFVGVWLRCVRKNKNKQCLPCFVVRGAKISEDKMQDKVQQTQNDILPPTPAEAEGEQMLDKMRQKQNDTLPPTEGKQLPDKVRQKQNDTLRHTPAEGEQDGWTAAFSPVLALGGFFSSMVSPVPPQEELSPKEPSNPPPSISTKSSSRFNSNSSDVQVTPPETSSKQKNRKSCKETSSSLLNSSCSDAKPSPTPTPPKRKDVKKTTRCEAGGGVGGRSHGEPQQSRKRSIRKVGRVQKELAPKVPSNLVTSSSSSFVSSGSEPSRSRSQASTLPFPVVEVTVSKRDIYRI